MSALRPHSFLRLIAAASAAAAAVSCLSEPPRGEPWEGDARLAERSGGTAMAGSDTLPRAAREPPDGALSAPSDAALPPRPEGGSTFSADVGAASARTDAIGQAGSPDAASVRIDDALADRRDALAAPVPDVPGQSSRLDALPSPRTDAPPSPPPPPPDAPHVKLTWPALRGRLRLRERRLRRGNLLRDRMLVQVQLVPRGSYRTRRRRLRRGSVRPRSRQRLPGPERHGQVRLRRRLRRRRCVSLGLEQRHLRSRDLHGGIVHAAGDLRRPGYVCTGVVSRVVRHVQVRRYEVQDDVRRQHGLRRGLLLHGARVRPEQEPRRGVHRGRRVHVRDLWREVLPTGLQVPAAEQRESAQERWV